MNRSARPSSSSSGTRSRKNAAVSIFTADPIGRLVDASKSPKLPLANTPDTSPTSQ
jgi:hypothetical protein